MPSLMLIEGKKGKIVYMCINRVHISAVKALEPQCRSQTLIFSITSCKYRKNFVSKYSAVLSPLGGGIDFVVVTSSQPVLWGIARARQIISECCAGSTDPVFLSAARIAVRIILKCLSKVSCMVSPLPTFPF